MEDVADAVGACPDSVSDGIDATEAGEETQTLQCPASRNTSQCSAASAGNKEAAPEVDSGAEETMNDTCCNSAYATALTLAVLLPNQTKFVNQLEGQAVGRFVHRGG